MKKKLLLGAFLLGSFLTVKAQDSCSTAVDISAGGTFTSGDVAGTYEPSCFGGSTNSDGEAIFANWYAYTPSANGLLTISSDLASNDGTTNSDDTRISIFTGACGALECYNGNDDISSSNYLSTITVPVESGVTYYVAWDSYWLDLGFDFSVTFEAADCLSPNTLGASFSDLTTSSATFSWAEAIGSPAGYDVEVGVIGFTPEDGSADTFTSTTNSVGLDGLSTSENVGLDVYVRSNCGASQGEWVGPYRLRLAVTLPYSNSFDVTTNRQDGFILSGWTLLTNTQAGSSIAQSGDGFVFTNTSTSAAADAWMFGRPVNLAAGETVTMSFYSVLVGAAGVSANFDVTVGAEPTEESQTVVESFTTDVATTTYQQRVVSWTATDAGVYYLGIHHNSPATSGAASLVVDTFSFVSGELGTEDFLTSQLSIYPNPATDVINVANAQNISDISIVDLNGRVVKSVKFSGASEAQVNISDLSAGMYLMNVSSDQGTTTKKIVKK